MTAPIAASMRRPGRRARFPETLPDPEDEVAAAIASLRFDVMLADRASRIDLTMLAGRKALARTFAGALWRACQVGGPAGSISTAYAYANALKTFWRYLDSAGMHVARLSDVRAALIDAFDAWMEESGLHPNHRLHRMSKVLNLLRLAEARQPRCRSNGQSGPWDLQKPCFAVSLRTSWPGCRQTTFLLCCSRSS